MKDIYRNPILYYVLVPLVTALWPLLVWTLYLPGARHTLNEDKSNYNKAAEKINAILELDPGRLDFAGSQAGNAEFDYTITVNKVAELCRISSASYRLSSGIIITSGGQKSQNAKVALKGVDITRFARFLSTIQLRWANLQCTKIKLTKKKGLPNAWDVDLEFKYYY